MRKDGTRLWATGMMMPLQAASQRVTDILRSGSGRNFVLGGAG